MRKLINVGVLTISAVAIISTGYATAKTNDTKSNNTENNTQLFPTRWQLVKQTFQIRVPKHGKPLKQLIVETPSNVAVSNDISVFDDKAQKVNIDISVDNKKIIITFPEAVTSSTSKILVSLNRVQQPTDASGTVYNLLAKVIGSDVEIPIGQVRFQKF
ncbi:hypothetical protein DSM106972_066690 [Dulcicalothrix desertica PCC 7102]|uniref:DUF2808 domain-containing protein n=2 Tax=Dulcicalothrix desertica TaxID=32056 RepID=A0A433V641_9CYAN|nr:hypothetical protein DSM106972_066690 [Dulcicalothrix desertica PCC 7102]